MEVPVTYFPVVLDTTLIDLSRLSLIVCEMKVWLWKIIMENKV